MAGHYDHTSIDPMLTHLIELDELPKSYNRESFLRDRNTQHIAACLLQIFGEAANRVTSHTRDANQEVPWRDIIDLRNVIAIACDQVDYRIIWEVVRIDVPNLIAQIERLADEGPE